MNSAEMVPIKFVVASYSVAFPIRDASGAEEKMIIRRTRKIFQEMDLWIKDRLQELPSKLFWSSALTVALEETLIPAWRSSTTASKEMQGIPLTSSETVPVKFIVASYSASLPIRDTADEKMIIGRIQEIFQEIELWIEDRLQELPSKLIWNSLPTAAK